MKSQFARMKTRAKAGSTRTLALVLSFIMLLTVVGSGSVLSVFAQTVRDDAYIGLATQTAAKAAQSVSFGDAEAADPAPADAEDAAAQDAAAPAAQPDLSGFAENDLVRGIKADAAPISREKKDLAGTGANADLAGTGWTDIAVPGDMNGWNTGANAMSGAYYELNAGQTYKFKVFANNVWFSNNQSLSANSDLIIHQNTNTGDMSFTPTKGNVTFYTWNDSNSQQIGVKWLDAAPFTLHYGASLNNENSSVEFKRTATNTYQATASLSANSTYYLYVKGTNSDYYRANTTITSSNRSATMYKYDSNGNNHAVKIQTTNAGTYTFNWSYPSGDAKTLTVTYPAAPSYYLTGWLNGSGYSGTAYKFTGSGDNYNLTFNNSTTAAQYLTVTDSSGNTYHPDPNNHPGANGAPYTYTDTNPTGDSKWGITSGASGKKITFTWKPTSKTLSWTLGSGGSVDVYAKDGAAPIDWDHKDHGGATSLSGYNGKYYYNYARIATTSIDSPGGATSYDCDINNGNSGSKYQFKSIASGTKITVTTTIANENSWRTKYYVAGWCVNGITYKNGTDTVGVNANPGTSTTSYTFNYTIPDVESLPKDTAGNPVVEITPIYYRQDKADTVTFYIEGYTDVQSKWGNTPYVYPFYGDLDGYRNTFGTYPGQPAVNVGGQMSTEIPIKSKAIYDTTKDNTVIKGVTISNGYADYVHRDLVYNWKTGTNVNDDKDHMQTYDFDDFYKIYAERKDSSNNPPNQIFFRFREETTKYNRSTYGGGSTNGQFASGISNISISTINSSGNGWELLKDRHDRPVNLFGDYSAVSNVTPSSATNDTSKALYVVSTGYNANIAGDYGTMWKVYNGSGQLISTDSANSRYGIPPSLLHVNGSTSGMTPSAAYPDANRSVVGVGNYTDAHAKYNNIYKALKAAGYNNKIVYVTYEKDTQDTRHEATGEGAYRADGQWFYTFASDMVKSTIGIEYYNKSTGKWVADTVSPSTGIGTTTQATAKFDSESAAGASNVTTSKETVTSAATTLNFTASESGTGYAFDGWFLKYDNTYDPITGATNIGTIKSTANYQLIARYIPVVTGSLTVSYKLDPTSTGTKDTMSLSVKYGSNDAVNGVLGDDGVYRATISGVTHTTTASNIVVTLTAKPKHDGKVSAFGKDTQVTYASESSPTFGGENTLVTKTYTFTNNDLYSDADHTTQLVTDLEYTAKIDATPHYYEFTYAFNDRSDAEKKYTARGEITEDHYEEYVSGGQITDAFVKSRAPFESNFLKTLKLGTISGKTYSSHTFTASSTYNATAYTPIYDVKIKLPYDYYTESGGSGVNAYKKYTASSSTYNASKVAFTLKANYDEFVTIGASDTQAGLQTKVSKVVNEAADPNHTGNNFITAPNTLSGGRYFKYWEIKRLADTESAQTSAPVIARIYFPDLNYRFYADSYVEAVYTTNEDEYWSNVNKNHSNTELSASVLYLESSRNQYNTVANGTSTSAANAADIIYNDFIFNYRLGDQEYISAAQAEVGVVIERVMNSDSTAWVKGSDSVTNMDSYKDANAGTEAARKAAIESWLGGGSAPKGCVKQVWNNSELINKNFTEQNYPVYSQYGQTVSDHSITFTNNNAGDTYVYRAWAYIIDKNNNNAVAVSDPAYFSMNYIAAQNYKD